MAKAPTGTSTGGHSTGGRGSAAGKGSRDSRGSKGSASREARGADAEYLCTFTVGGQRYALSTDLVRELVEVTSVTPVPRTDEAILGLFNLRGEPMPLVDLALVLGLRMADAEAKMSVVIVRHEELSLGARIDALGMVVPDRGVVATADPNPLVRGFLPASGTEGPIAVISPGEFVMRLERLKFGGRQASKGALG